MCVFSAGTCCVVTPLNHYVWWVTRMSNASPCFLHLCHVTHAVCVSKCAKTCGVGWFTAAYIKPLSIFSASMTLDFCTVAISHTLRCAWARPADCGPGFIFCMDASPRSSRFYPSCIHHYRDTLGVYMVFLFRGHGINIKTQNITAPRGEDRNPGGLGRVLVEEHWDSSREQKWETERHKTKKKRINKSTKSTQEQEFKQGLIQLSGSHAKKLFSRVDNCFPQHQIWWRWVGEVAAE